MSVLIRGMKMPEDCPVCPLAHWNKLDRFTGCELKKRYFDKEDMETRGRPCFCPLIELPAEHGRLIDAGEFEVVSYKGIPDGYRDTFDDGVLWMCEKIDNTQTIIEAEEVKE